jgi:putative DNA-invertase from lambdoid prophage Rac
MKNKPQPRAVIYARVSTTDQHNTVQIHDLKEYVKHRTWKLAAVYQDKISGAKASRPGLDQLMAAARQRQFDVVLVQKLDRFGRSLVQCISGIQELSSLGIRFIATSQGIDTDESNPSSKLLLHLLAAFAQFEREIIRERVVAGLEHARRKGVRLGRPRSVEIDARRLAKVAALHGEGHSFSTIAKRLKLNRATLYKAHRVSAGTWPAMLKSNRRAALK